MSMRPYLMISGDFVETGGMDMANLALARYLSDAGGEVHLVAHRVSPELEKRSNVHVHRVPKPLRSYYLGESLLDRLGRHWASIIDGRRGRVVVNGGNCRWEASNWVHYVHAAYEPDGGGRLRRRLIHRSYLRREREALLKSRVIITNSTRTAADIAERFDVSPNSIKTVYYGINADRFQPPSSEERARARALLKWLPSWPVILFVGSPSDTRKGFPTLFEAWKRLCKDPAWDGHLAVAGAEAGLATWKPRVLAAGVHSKIHLLGFRKDISTVLRACDALVSPARYEAYGLAAHEGLCCGLPVLITRSAGVAERYPRTLNSLLLDDPHDVEELICRLRDWRTSSDRYRDAASDFSCELRRRTWDHACKQLVDIIEDAG